MGMSVGSGGDDAPMMDMNTTPLIDVMLVLLIMFIITIPIQTHAVKIDLPIAPEDPPDIPVDPIKNTIYILADGTVVWNEDPVDSSTLWQLLLESKNIEPEPELQIQPEAYANYIDVDRVLATVKRSGVTKLGFVGNEQYARVF